MRRFTATNSSEAVVSADRTRIWQALTDPELLPKLTPLLRRIDADRDIWRWHLTRLSVLGVDIATTCTERMRFDDERRIEFSHEPPERDAESVGVDGRYELSDVPEGTHLAITLTVHLELPLPRLAEPEITATMRSTMRRIGDRFSANLLRRLDAREVASPP